MVISGEFAGDLTGIGIGVDRCDSFAANDLFTSSHPSAQPQLPQQLPFDAVISPGARMAVPVGIAAKVTQLLKSR
jgi:hypothetical protein